MKQQRNRWNRAKSDRGRHRLTPFTYADLTNRHGNSRLRVMQPEHVRLLGDREEASKVYLERELRLAWEGRHTRQYPYDRIHRVMRQAGLVHCSVYLDPPKWVKVWEWVNPPRVVKDRWGRVLHMDKGTKEFKKIRPEDFSPVVTFEPLYPMHPDPANITEEDKERRIAAYLNAYAATGLITASARYVGVNYFHIIMWVNESEERQAQLLVAEAAAKLIMVDIGRQRAMSGDAGMLRFFIERDNPDKFGRGGKKANNLPDGVTEDAVVSALDMIRKAQEASDSREAESATLALVDQRNSVTDMINNLSSPPCITIEAE